MTTIQTEKENPSTTTVGTRTKRRKLLLAVPMIAILLLGCLVVWAYSRTGSAALIPRFLAGERLLIGETVVSLGEQRKGTTARCGVWVVNATGGEVKVLGADRSCECVAVDEFPLSLPRGERRDLTLAINIGERTGEFEESVKFFTDYPGVRAFKVSAHGVAP